MTLSRALSAWTELLEGLEETPLFPLKPLAYMLQLLLPLWSTQAEWRRLLDLVDDEIGIREGNRAVAERARDRAIALMNADRLLEALEELHRARVDWWSGDTVRESVLRMPHHRPGVSAVAAVRGCEGVRPSSGHDRCHKRRRGVG